MVDALRQDVRFAMRSLRRSPVLAFGVVLLLSLGIGANAAIFSLADTLFLRQPDGVARPENLRRLYALSNWSVGEVTEIHSEFSVPAYRAIADAYGGRVQLAAYSTPDSVALGSSAKQLQVVYATANFLAVLGVHPAIGRFFDLHEDEMGAAVPVAVISHGVWQHEFGGDAGVLGRSLDVAGLRYTIIGVAPPGFTGSDLNRTDVWLPLSTHPGNLVDGTPWYANWRSRFIVRLIGRVADASASNVWLSKVGTAAFRHGEQANVPTHPDTATIIPGPLLETLGPSIKPRVESLITTRLMGVTLLVLIIACANVGNLLLLQMIRRRQEIAIRLAMGISRRRLVSQLLTESLLLSLMSGIAAVGVAIWTGHVLRGLLLPSVHWVGTPLNAVLVAASLALALCVGLATGLLPALGASRPDLTEALKAGARETGGRHSRMRNTLIVAQAALSFVLLAGAGLFVHSLHAVLGLEVGYSIDRLVYGLAVFRSPSGRYLSSYPENRDVLATGLTSAADRLAHDVAVERVALSTAAPMAGYAMPRGLFFANGNPVPHINNRDPAVLWVTPSSGWRKTATCRLSSRTATSSCLRR